MTKSEYLKRIELNINDDAGEFTKSCKVTDKILNVDGNTDFTCDTVKEFAAIDEVFIKDLSEAYFTIVKAVDTTNKIITIEGDLTRFSLGSVIKKTDAFYFLENALKTYSRFKPLIKVTEAINPNGYTVALPNDWTTSHSYIYQVEVFSDVYPKNYIDDALYQIGLVDNVPVLTFHTPITYDILIYYALSHSFNEEPDPISTVPDIDAQAVIDIASAYYCISLATKYAQTITANIGAELVDHQLKTDQYLKLYDVFLNKAAMWLNVDVNELKKGIAVDEPASLTQELPAGYDTIVPIVNYY